MKKGLSHQQEIVKSDIIAQFLLLLQHKHHVLQEHILVLQEIKLFLSVQSAQQVNIALELQILCLLTVLPILSLTIQDFHLILNVLLVQLVTFVLLLLKLSQKLALLANILLLMPQFVKIAQLAIIVRLKPQLTQKWLQTHALMALNVLS